MEFSDFIYAKSKYLTEKKTFLRILKINYETEDLRELFRAYQEFFKVKNFIINYLKKLIGYKLYNYLNKVYDKLDKWDVLSYEN